MILLCLLYQRAENSIAVCISGVHPSVSWILNKSAVRSPSNQRHMNEAHRAVIFSAPRDSWMSTSEVIHTLSINKFRNIDIFVRQGISIIIFWEARCSPLFNFFIFCGAEAFTFRSLCEVGLFHCCILWRRMFSYLHLVRLGVLFLNKLWGQSFIKISMVTEKASHDRWLHGWFWHSIKI